MRRMHLWGWILFLMSSILYLARGLQDGDGLMIAGSVAFLLGVILLITPDRSRPPDDDDRDSES